MTPTSRPPPLPVVRYLVLRVRQLLPHIEFSEPPPVVSLSKNGQHRWGFCFLKEFL